MAAKASVVPSDAGHRRLAVILTPTHKEDVLEDMVHHCTFFALHPCRPYATAFEEEGIVRDVNVVRAGAKGFLSNLNNLQKLYARPFSGPFTTGVFWQDAGIVALHEN